MVDSSAFAHETSWQELDNFSSKDEEVQDGRTSSPPTLHIYRTSKIPIGDIQIFRTVSKGRRDHTGSPDEKGAAPEMERLRSFTADEDAP